MNALAWLALGTALASPPEFAPLTPEEEARRDALTRYGMGYHSARIEKPSTAVRQLVLAAERDPKAAAPHRELARVYAELGRDSSAIREARTALALDPSDSTTALLLAKLLKAGNDHAGAVDAYKLAVESAELQGQPAKLFGTLGDMGRTAAAAKNHAVAETAFNRALGLASKQRAELLKPGTFEPRELDRTRVELYERLGEVQIALKRFDAATAAFETARDLAANPNGANSPAATARIHSNLSRLHAEKGDGPAALAELEKYLAFLPASVLPYERYADLMRTVRRGKEILPALRRFAQRNPKNTGLPWLIAAEELRAGVGVPTGGFPLEGGDTESVRILVKALFDTKKYGILLGYADDLAKAARGREGNPKAASNHANVAAVEQARHLHAAIKAERGHTATLLQQLALDFTSGTTRSAETLELVNYLAFRDGLQGELAAALQTAAKSGKASAELYKLLFAVLRDRKQWRELIRIAEPAKEIPALKNSTIPYSMLATAYAELGDERQCLQELDRLTPFLGADGKVWGMEQKARLLNILGKPREALKVCSAIREEFPAASAQRSAALIEADAYHRLKDHTKAEGILRELLARDPDDVLVLNNLGYHLADQGRKLPEAETMIRRAIELDREERLRNDGTAEADRGTYLDSLGWVLFRRGDLEQARELLLKATQHTDSASDAIVWDHLGDVQYRMGQKADAKKSWAKAVELYKDSHLGREAGRLDEARRKLELP
jgi:tetratricopeptide (TPR) repeat protein